MSKIEFLEQKVRRLSRRELSKFRNWFENFEAEVWDRQIEKGVKSGKLEKLAAKALSAHKRGESRPI